MNHSKQTVLTKDLPNKKITVTREFDAPLNEVWNAWTEREILDQWWAPKPWRAQTKSLDFREGGIWLYCMVGPQNEQQWCRTEFTRIDPPKSFSSTSWFCNEKGEITNDFPPSYWTISFSESDGATKVVTVLAFDTEAGLEQLLASGFQEGFTMAHGNLDSLISTDKKG